jgi:hypothetical protein
MRIKVPSMVDLYPPMMGGMAGLGQDEDNTTITLPVSVYTDLTEPDIADLESDYSPILQTIQMRPRTRYMGRFAGLGDNGDDDDTSITLPSYDTSTPVLDTSTELPAYSGGGATTVSTPAGDYQIVGSTIYDPNGNVSSVSALQSALGVSPSSSSAPSLTQILSAAAAVTGAGAQAYKSLQTPSLIPGTNLVYNPATGQISSATGLTAAGLLAASTTSSLATSLSSMGPVLLIGGALLLILMMGGRR